MCWRHPASGDLKVEDDDIIHIYLANLGSRTLIKKFVVDLIAFFHLLRIRTPPRGAYLGILLQHTVASASDVDTTHPFFSSVNFKLLLLLFGRLRS